MVAVRQLGRRSSSLLSRGVGVARAAYVLPLGNFNVNNPRAHSSSSTVDFNNVEKAFRSKTMVSLFRAYVVFAVCRNSLVVRHAESLLRASYRILGEKTTNALLRLTYFGHFCAGEDAKSIQPTVDYLERNGIGSILDYAAESDVVEAASPEAGSTSTAQSVAVQCRVYSYKDEALCDQHVATFEQCIRAVKEVSPTGFAAIKMTALGNPLLLQRMSEAIDELRLLFAKFDTPAQTGLVTQEQFLAVYAQVFSGGDEEGRRLFKTLDKDGDGRVDYVDWSNSLTVEELHTLTSRCRSQGPLSRAVLDEQERALVRTMRGRVEGLAALASSLGVRLMIDAEHFKFQPAIDNITTQLAKSFNRGDKVVIFSTYQMYLRDSRRRLDQDMRRARQGGYGFACKLVRGAYMHMERREAQEHGRPDPVHASLQDTHDCYNSAVGAVIAEVAKGASRVELMIASHNQQSVELALQELRRQGLDAAAPVYFGTLLGMADHLSFSLGAAKFKAYKYVPYGRVQEVMPYLVRRAQENSGLLGGATAELQMIRAELKRRLFPGSTSKRA